jgi:HEAT repeat protein
MVLISSPGACQQTGEDDWVYKEINWWATHRPNAAPVVVETTGEGDRWVPEAVKAHWPGIQWIEITNDWLDSKDVTEEERRRILRRLLAGFAASEREVRNQQVVELENLIARNSSLIKRLWIALASTIVAVVFAVYFAISAYEKEQEAREATNDARAKAAELGAAHEKVSKLAAAEYAERLKAQFLLALRDGRDEYDLNRLAGQMVTLGPASIPAFLQSVSAEYSPPVIEIAGFSLRAICDPSCIHPLLRKMAFVINETIRVTTGPQSPSAAPYRDRLQYVREIANSVLEGFGKEGIEPLLDFNRSLRQLPRDHEVFRGPGLSAVMNMIATQLARQREISVPFLIESLGEPGRTFVAIGALGVIGTKAKAASPHLRPFLESQEPTVRLKTAVALARIGLQPQDTDKVFAVLSANFTDREALRGIKAMGPSAKSVAPTLAQWLLEPGRTENRNVSPDLTKFIIETLNAIQPDDKLSLEAYRVHLANTNNSVRLAAIDGLGGTRIHISTAIALLVEVLDDRYLPARRKAEESLGAKGASNRSVANQIVASLTAKKPIRAQYLRTIAAIGPKAAMAEDFLRTVVIGHEAPKLRSEAIIAFGRVADFSDANWNLIIRHFKEEDSTQDVPTKALNSFTRRHPEAQRRIARLINGQPELGSRVLVALKDVEISHPALNQKLRQIANDRSRNSKVREEAIVRLSGSTVALTETAGDLLAFVGDAELGSVTMEALQSLAEKDDAVVVKITENLETDASENLLLILTKLGRNGASATPVLRGLLQRHPDRRIRILRALAAFGPLARQAEQDLLEIVKSGIDDGREDALDALKHVGFTSADTTNVLLEQLRRKDTNLTIRSKTGEALKGLDPHGVESKAIRQLASHLTDEDWLVRKYVKLALIQLGGAAISPLAESVLDGNSARRRAALEIITLSIPVPSHDVDSIIPGLADSDPEVQTLAVRAVMRSHTEDPRVADALQKSLDSDSPEVQIETLKAIVRLKIRSATLGQAVAAKTQSEDREVRSWAVWARERLTN